jgi:hypothetical protein
MNPLYDVSESAAGAKKNTELTFCTDHSVSDIQMDQLR